MKAFALLAAFLLAAFSSFADATNLFEKFSPHFSTRTKILWQAPVNPLPKSFWIYKMIRPHIFPAMVISNAIVLASFQSKGFPQPSTNDTCILADPDCDCQCLRVCNFSIRPNDATLSFYSPDQNHLTNQIPGDEAVVKWAWNCAFRLGVDPAQVVVKDLTSHFNSDTNDNPLTNQLSGRGVFLARLIDGVQYIGDGDDGFRSEGFWIEFGSYGQIRNFTLVWPNLERYENSPAATPRQIIACLRAHKAIVLPNPDEENYFARLKILASAKKLTITKITPYYSEGVYGEMPTNDAPSEWVAPIAELEAVADFGNSNMLVRLYSPALSSEMNRLLANTPK